MKEKAGARSTAWICWSAEAALLLVAGLPAWAAQRAWKLDLFLSTALFFFALVSGTLIFLALLRRIWPFRAGAYPSDSPLYRRWRLHDFLCTTNLFLFYQSAVVPPPFRKFVARLLGGRIAPGLISIGGVVADPYFVTIGKGAMIGIDALLMPATVSGERLTLKPIEVGPGAVVGARCLVMPGVVVGEGAMVKAMSLVPEDTQIPAFEVWGGVPAQKLGELARVAAPEKFSGWRDKLITPLASGAVFLAAAASCGGIWRAGAIGEPFVAMAVFYGFFVAWTLLAMAGLRAVSPITEGTYSFEKEPAACYVWSLHYVFCMFNLFIPFQNGLLPLIVRPLFYRLIGARLEPSFFLMPGILTDPYLITVGRNSVVDHDALFLPHAVTTDSVVLRKITVGEGAFIGSRAVLMPGVSVGNGAEVQSGTLVTMDTKVPDGEIWAGIPARPVGTRSGPGHGDRFKAWTDYILNPLAEVLILAGAVLAAAKAWALWPMGIFGAAVVFYFAQAALALLLMALLRAVWPFEEGTFSRGEKRWAFYRWRLHGFLCATNLFLHYNCGVLPGPMRRLLYQWMGARFGRGTWKITGLLADPTFVTIEDQAVIGFDSVILALRFGGDSVTLRRVRVGRGAEIGARAIMLPGVTVGEGARIEPFSVVPAGTTIPAFEIWAGNPAKKVGDRARGQE